MKRLFHAFETGFSLIETLVSTAILSVISVGLMNLSDLSLMGQQQVQLVRVLMSARSAIEGSLKSPAAWDRTIAGNHSFQCATTPPGCALNAANAGYYDFVVIDASGTKLSFDAGDLTTRLTPNGSHCENGVVDPSSSCAIKLKARWKPICDTYPCLNPSMDLKVDVVLDPAPTKSTINPSNYGVSIVRGLQANDIQSACLVLNGVYNAISNTCRPKYAGKSCAGTEGMPGGIVSSVHQDGSITCTPLFSGACDPTTQVVKSIDSSGHAVCGPKDCSCRYSKTWGACSQVCGGGTQTEIITVISPPTGAGSLCPAPQTQACNTQSCHWQTYGWSACSQECNGGTQTQVVKCIDSNTGNPTSDTVCLSDPTAGPKPATSQSCNTASCSWNYGSWGSCSISCGADGTQTRTATCQNNNTGASAGSTALCGGASVTSQTCNNGPCPVDCVGSFSACSPSCGPGTQMYTVTTPKVGTGRDCPYRTGDINNCNLGTCSASNCTTNSAMPWGNCTGTRISRAIDSINLMTVPDQTTVPAAQAATIAACQASGGTCILSYTNSRIYPSVYYDCYSGTAAPGGTSNGACDW